MDTTIVDQFEAGTIDHCSFGHTQHVFVIWSLIHRYGVLDAIRRFADNLIRITTEMGDPDKYNATITHALGFIVAERIDEQPDAEWDDFVTANPDLFEWPNARLERLYPDGELYSERARRRFVLPSAGRAALETI